MVVLRCQKREREGNCYRKSCGGVDGIEMVEEGMRGKE